MDYAEGREKNRGYSKPRGEAKRRTNDASFELMKIA